MNVNIKIVIVCNCIKKCAQMIRCGQKIDWFPFHIVVSKACVLNETLTALSVLSLLSGWELVSLESVVTL